MLNGTKTQSDGRNTEAAPNKMAKLRAFYPRRACNSSKGRRMVNTWTSDRSS